MKRKFIKVLDFSDKVLLIFLLNRLFNGRGKSNLTKKKKHLKIKGN